MGLKANPRQSNREIYLAAMELIDPAARRAYLDQVCEGNVERRAQIEQLLAAHTLERTNPLDKVIDLLGSGGTQSSGPSDRQRWDWTAPPVIDRYTIREQIGEGGMGVVFVAEQTRPVRRKVALKIIKPGMYSQSVIARFEAERQALALMSHPNIARVLDAATTDDGRPYFVMELVFGVPITRFCDDNQLTNRKRLTLFVDVCSAVEHAHQKGIIHRDLKPSNILVTMNDDKPEPKVIDFGIAKALTQPLTEHSIYTAYDQMVGTPLYMSPEQAQYNSVDVDTRSDVYSLGVLLYELLTGSTPFDKKLLQVAGFDEVRHLIREVDPPCPSRRVSTLNSADSSTASSCRQVDTRRLTQSLAGELDWIVMKALEKSRDRRYGTAKEFARDIERYLADQPVEACPPSTWYRFSKLARRNRALLSTSVLVGLAVVIGTGVSAWQAIRATQAEQHAQSRSQLARRAVDEMYSQFAEKWVSEQGDLTAVQREFLEKALAHFTEFASNAQGDPQLQFESLRALERVAAIQAKLGEHSQAETSYRKLIADSGDLISKHPAYVGFWLERISARTAIAKLIRPLGRENHSAREAILAYSDLEHVAIDPTVFGDLAQREWFAATLSSLVGQLTQAGKLPEAEKTVQRCLDLWQSLVNEDPNSWDYRLGMAKGYSVLGMHKMWWGGKNAEAEAAYREADKQFSTLMEERPRDRSCRLSRASALHNLGVICSWENRSAEGADFDRQAVAISESLVNDFPEDDSLRRSLLISVGNLAGSLKIVNGGENVAEELQSRKRQFALAQDLADRIPNDLDIGIKYMDASSSLTRLARRSSPPDDVELVEDAVLQRIPRFVALARSNEDNSIALANRNTNFVIMAAVRRLESGDHARAAKTLGLIPPSAPYQPHQFSEGFTSRVSIHGRKQADRWLVDRLALGFEGCYLPSMALLECARAAENDEVLSLEERAACAEAYRSLAGRFRVEADRALDSWTQAVQTSISFNENKGDYVVLGTCEEYCKEANEGMDGYSTLERRLIRDVERQFCRALIRVGVERYPLAPAMHNVVGYLTAGPEELRDRALALEIARQAADEYPDHELARQDLGWALFRNEQWDEGLQVLLSGASDADPAEFDITNRAIIAMSMWHLGRKEKAALCIGTDYDRALKSYIEQCDKALQAGTFTYPTPAMLRRLDQEAKELVSPSRE